MTRKTFLHLRMPDLGIDWDGILSRLSTKTGMIGILTIALCFIIPIEAQKYHVPFEFTVIIQASIVAISLINGLGSDRRD